MKSSLRTEPFARRRVRFGLGIFLLLLYAGLAYGIYAGFTQHTPGANDFYSRWMGARALILHGQNPYADAVTREIQIGMYGRLAQPDEDQVAFAYPLYAAYLAAPLVVLPYTVAQALWMAMLVYCVVGGALALALVNRVSLSPVALASILLGALFFYPAVRGIFLGQYALVSFACIAFAGLAIVTGHDVTAGILLGISTVKPQPVIFFVPVILFWAFRNGRLRILASALAMLAVLLLSCFVWTPTWVADFLNGLRAYAQYAPVGPPLETFLKMLLPEQFVGFAVIVCSALLVIGLGIVVWRNALRGWFEFQPTLGLVALVTTLTAGRIGSPDQILLLALWMPWLAAWCAQKHRVVVAGCVFALLFVPWYVFLTALRGNKEAFVVTTLLPIASLGVFLLVTLLHLRSQRIAI